MVDDAACVRGVVADALCGGEELADAAACCADWSALLADWTTLPTLVAGAVEAGADVEAAAEFEAGAVEAAADEAEAVEVEAGAVEP